MEIPKPGGGSGFEFDQFEAVRFNAEDVGELMWRLLAEQRRGVDWRQTAPVCDPLRLPGNGVHEDVLLFARLEADHKSDMILQKENPEDVDSDFDTFEASVHEMAICLEDELQHYQRFSALELIKRSHIEQQIMDAVAEGKIEFSMDSPEDIAAKSGLMEEDKKLEWLDEEAEALSLRIGERYKVFSYGGMVVEHYRVALDGENRFEIPVHSSELLQVDLEREEFTVADLRRIEIGCRIFNGSPIVMEGLEELREEAGVE